MTKSRIYWGVLRGTVVILGIAVVLSGCGTAARTSIKPSKSAVLHEQQQPSKTTTTRVRVGDPKRGKP